MNEVADMQVVPASNLKPLTAMDIRAQVNLIKEVMNEVMQKDQHYGTIPGCGDKPALFKPGAEKLASTFRLACDPIIEDLSDSDSVRYRVTVRLTHQTTGIFMGAGIGECSSNEDKYKWKSAVNNQEFDETPVERRRAKWKRGWSGSPDSQLKQIRNNPADNANTVLKMAKKRALVDAVLTVTAASDIFTQDIEEMDVDVVSPQGKKIAEPQPKPKPEKTVAERIQTGIEGISKSFNVSLDKVLDYVAGLSFETDKEVLDHLLALYSDLHTKKKDASVVFPHVSGDVSKDASVSDLNRSVDCNEK